MKNFTYYRPKTAKEAVALLDAKWGTSELLAGGTDLHDLQKEYVAQPDKVVSVIALDIPFNAATILPAKKKGDSDVPPMISIGAGAKLADIADSEYHRKYFPALTTAAGQIGG